MAFLSIDNVSHQYFTKMNYTKALQSISLSVEEGQFISFIGPSGCGKSTLLSIIAGIITPTEGSVRVNNTTVQRPSVSIGYMLQQDYLFPWKTIVDNVLLGPHIKGTLTNGLQQLAIQSLTEIGLEDVLHAYPSQLSGGMRQRAALVRTLMTDPHILLLDEPFSALDYQTKLKLEDLVSNTLKQFNKTSILVTHDIGEAIAMSDKIYLFSASPGSVFSSFHVPENLQQLTPFEARQHHDFPALFQHIWEELNSLESSTNR
ncbi:ABC transporter ATP-binding protein [Pontibacillus litoralis]|uniref:Spermidine/putrescine ABC transporter ATP-binding protein n=1 Tax=Pontibacillus litoralis JSM 072002 TaxID=1385512 RepID=A0A0A5G0X1_9BACI|nr:ABC transporter ATP-binding protein [Pontibacillus litoralis]KGX86756.1 spermidine/putrescine ABC transporter ATP-binding protein [Pontibacillus litoralis JSM 072002]